MLYVNSGSRTDGDETGDDPRYSKEGEDRLTSCIWRLDPNADKPEIEIYARGLRNAYGFCWNDKGEMYATDNGPDADPPEELNHIEKGHHYGFPYRFSDWVKPPYIYTPDAAARPGLHAARRQPRPRRRRLARPAARTRSTRIHRLPASSISATTSRRRTAAATSWPASATCSTRRASASTCCTSSSTKDKDGVRDGHGEDDAGPDRPAGRSAPIGKGQGVYLRILAADRQRRLQRHVAGTRAGAGGEVRRPRLGCAGVRFTVDRLPRRALRRDRMHCK